MFSAAPAVTWCYLLSYLATPNPFPFLTGTAKPTPFSGCDLQMLGSSPPGWHGAGSGEWGTPKGEHGREGGLETYRETHKSDGGVQALDAGMPEAHL